MSPTFHNMLRQHLAFLAAKSKPAALKLEATIYEAIKALTPYPEKYPLVSKVSSSIEYRKMCVPNWFIIIYEVQEETVWVEYTIDCRKNNKWLLDK